MQRMVKRPNFPETSLHAIPFLTYLLLKRNLLKVFGKYSAAPSPMTREIDAFKFSVLGVFRLCHVL